MQKIYHIVWSDRWSSGHSEIIGYSSARSALKFFRLMTPDVEIESFSVEVFIEYD